jgi:integrase
MKGHLRERGSPGHWAIVIDQVIDGERKRRWHSFRGTKREAQIECARLIGEHKAGTIAAPNKVTVGEFVDKFEVDWVDTPHLTTRSAERYRAALAHVRRHLGDRLLLKLQPTDLSGFYADLARDGLAPRTVKFVHVVLHRALGLAVVWKLLRDNPATVIKPPKAPARETEMLQPKEAGRLLERLRGKPLYLLASVALATGARRNELLALRWSDLDLDQGRLRIEQALEQSGGTIRVKEPKTRHGRRMISLPAETVAELRRHWKDQQERRLAMGRGRAADASPVFASPSGTWESPDAISHAWERQMEGLGMSSVTFHSLRHTHASTLIAAGVDILTISRRLGHGSPKVTLEVYGHLVAGGDDRAAEIVGAAFRSAKS